MTERAYDPADARLTAYVLGELDDAERLAIEQQIAACPQTRAAVADIRETVGLVVSALAKEPAPALTDAQRAVIANSPAATLAVSRSPDFDPTLQKRRKRRNRISALIVALTVTAAAALLLVLPPVGRWKGGGESPRAELIATNARLEDSSRVDSDLSIESAQTGFTWEDNSRSQPVIGASINAADGSGRFGRPANEACNERGMAGIGGGLGGTPGDASRQFARPHSPSGAASSTGMPSSAPTVGFFSKGFANDGNGNPGQRLPSAYYFRDDIQYVPSRIESRLPNLRRSLEEYRKEQQSRIGIDHDFNVQDELPQGGEGKNPNPASEQYHPITDNPFLLPTQEPLSTFSIDVDTAAYSNVRRFLKHNQWPPGDAVRIEELLNYFHYDYPEPADGRPFSVHLEAGPCPWNGEHRLVRVGLKGKEIDKSQRPPSNLVFLLDVSGSMRDSNKLPLVKTAMEMLVGEMTEDDRIAIVTYAGNAGLALESTSGQDKPRIIDAIHALNAGGSTNGEAGIKLAYEQAVSHFIDDGANRVILCTDGDFNVGTSGDDELVTLIQDKAKSKVFLSVFGFGMGNIKDGKLEQIADKGNGQYGYIDDEREARKVFVEEMAGTLYTIAKDVKIQVEFNPQQVGAYRLIGYENRLLAAPDFNDDTKDAGEIGAGHTVTALYEIVPLDKLPAAKPVDGLKYQQPVKPAGDDEVSRELLTLKLRYKQPEADESVKIDFALTDDGPRTEMPSVDFEWAASVAGFGMLLRNSPYRGQADFDLIRELAAGSKGDDAGGRRQEFLDLVYAAQALRARQLGQPVPPAP